MSFSVQVKEELAGVFTSARHCQLAELAAIISMCGNIFTTAEGQHYIRVNSENRNVTIKCQSIIKKLFSYEPEASVRYNSDTKNRSYAMAVMDYDIALKILLSTKIMDTDGSINNDLALVSTLGISNMCCKRAYLRGAFFAAGSISDPEKYYHLEIVASGPEKATQVMDTMKIFDLDARMVERRRYYVVYLKEGAQIVDMLNVMGAHKSLLELENLRALKEMRNSINRQVNCETANLGKTVNAALKQIEDIRFYDEKVGLSNLSEGLLEVARLRLKYPDMSLKNLGEMLTPPVGKSGVNHRLRKISQLADELRQK